jgi:hypothetical protein
LDLLRRQLAAVALVLDEVVGPHTRANLPSNGPKVPNCFGDQVAEAQ